MANVNRRLGLYILIILIPILLTSSLVSMKPLQHRFAYAQSRKQKLEKERKRLLILKRKSEKARKELQRTLRKQKKLRKNVDLLKKELRRKTLDLKRVDKELAYIEKLLVKYDRRISSEKERRDVLVSLSKQISIGLVREGLRDSPWGHISVMSERDRYLSAIFFTQADSVFTRSRSREKSLEGKLTSLEGKREYWEKRGKREGKRKVRIEKTHRKRKKELVQVSRQRKNISKNYKKLQKNINALQKAVSRIERKARGKRKRRRNLFTKSVPSGYTYPTMGLVISRFGKRRDKKFNIYIENKGIEISGMSGGAVRAVFMGTVVYRGLLSGFGNVTVLEHSGDIFSVYGKAALYNVNVGDKVKKGQKIGALARGAPSLLYFELRIGGEPVNPLKYVRIPRR